jgi:hypothetical protein
VEFDSRNLDAESAYTLLIGAVVPRPIAWLGGPNDARLGEILSLKAVRMTPKS